MDELALAGITQARNNTFPQRPLQPAWCADGIDTFTDLQIGRKRHILVDTLGMILTAIVHVADIQDRDGALLVFERFKGCFPWVSLIWVDGGYAGDKLARQVANFGSFRLDAPNCSAAGSHEGEPN